MPGSKWPKSGLGQHLRAMEARFGAPLLPPLVGPLQMILWEIVGYLADDKRRLHAFEMLRDNVGLAPEKIEAATATSLCVVTRAGGSIAAAERADRLKVVARLVLTEFDGDLSSVLKSPPRQAKRSLRRFPMIGEPGADKILLFCGIVPILAPDSNGVRVLVRLSFGQEHKGYAATYRSVCEAAGAQLPPDCHLLTMAHLLLRHHGQASCRRSAPECDGCMVSSGCSHFRRLE